MSSATKTFLITSLSVISVIAVIIYYLEHRLNWSENYRMESKNPYGTQVIFTLLKENHPDNFHLIKESTDIQLKDFRSVNMNYVFIGSNYNPDDQEINDLLFFIGRGNNAFISANSLPQYLTDLFIGENCKDEFPLTNYSDTVNELELYGKLKTNIHPKLKYNDDEINYKYSWNYFDSLSFCRDSIPLAVLGSSTGGKINFLKLSYGRGNLFLHTTPICFTNYFIKNKDIFEYAGNVFSVLPPGEVIWDELAKSPKYSYVSTRNSEPMQGPLMFILSKESLRYAWYISLILLFLYVIFIGKRRQSVIPVIDPVKNTSLEFVKTVGKLYYLEKDHKSICIHKMKHFQTFLRNRYFILTTQLNDDFAKRISIVSGVSFELIKEIFLQFALIEVHDNLTDQEINKFHQSLTRFYKECN